MIHRELLINGTFIGGPCDQAIGKEVARSPWSGQVVGTFAEAGWPEADVALGAAHDALQSWRVAPHADRQQLCRRIAESVRDRRRELAELLVAEVGKPIRWAEAEVDRMAITFELSAKVPSDSIYLSLDADPRGMDYRATVQRFPFGVVLAISPYNWPFNLAAHKIGPALATGNTVVLKGSNQSGLCSLTLARLIHEAGCPAGVLNAVQCNNSVAQRMIEDSRVAAVSFTGSPSVGWMLKRLVPNKRVTLELGGNAFAIVEDGADLDDAVGKLVASAYGYAGQVCISAQNVLVARSRFEDFWERFAAATRDVIVVNPESRESLCGPLIDETSAERVEDWIHAVTDATSSSRVHRDGNRLQPVAVRIDDFAKAMSEETLITTEEVFGPVATVSPYDELSDAFEWINAGKFGIHTSIFGMDAESVRRAYRDLDVSGVIVNDAPTVRFDGMPYGGQKQSGFGREGVAYAAEEFTTPKVLLERMDLTR